MNRLSLAFGLLLAGSACAQSTIDHTIASSLSVDGSTTPPTWTFSWWGHFGCRYVVQTSPDLTTWTELPSYNPAGRDAELSITFDVQGADHYFFRAIQYDPLATSGFIDTDSDGLPDWWERTWFGDLTPTAGGNPDNDARNNLQELHLGANPTAVDADADGDGIVDAWEDAFGLDPGANDASLDPDGDGQTNAQEYAAGTNPQDHANGRAFVLDAPATGDGVFAYRYDDSGRLAAVTHAGNLRQSLTVDPAANLLNAIYADVPIVAWRIANGLPADGTSTGADTANPAGDGLPNLAKYAFGLDPAETVISAHPVVRLTTVSGYSFLTLTYLRPNPAPADVQYMVEVSGDGGATWQATPEDVVTVSTVDATERSLVTVRDATAVGSPAFGRRIRLSITRIP